MAKILHRHFEIYETSEEAIRALTSRAEKAAKTSATSDAGTFKHLAVHHRGGVLHVKFAEAADFDAGTVAGLREDFAQLANKLAIDTRVVVDFTKVVLFDAAFIDALLVFSRQLRTKGSRLALCCLTPAARKFFLPDDRERPEAAP